MPDESYEEKWNRLQRIVQHDILANYPNPDRKGCPGLPALHGLAERAQVIFDASLEDDPEWQHVTHCSPCYAEYLEEFRNLAPLEFPELDEADELADDDNDNNPV